MIIKFNLIPKPKIEEIPEKKKYLFLKFYSLLLILIILGLGAYFIKSQSEISSLEKIKKERETTLNKYKEVASKVKKMESEKEELKRQIETMVNLKAKQGKNLKNLYAILSKVNYGKLIFTNLKLDSSKAVIKGLGLDMDFLALFMEELEKEKEVIKSLNLKTAQQKNVGDLKFIEFVLEMQF